MLKPRKATISVKGAKTTLASVAFLGFIVAFLISGTGFAQAHAQLIATYPLDGSSSQIPPKQVTLTWGEDVRTTSNQFSIVSTVGLKENFSFSYHFDSTTSEGTVTLLPTHELARGSYIVSWKVISHDGHLVGGAFSFGVGVAAATVKQQSSSSPFDEMIQALFWIFIIISFGAVLAGKIKIFLLASASVILASVIRLISSYLSLGSEYMLRGSSRISLLAIALFGINLALVLSNLRSEKFSQVFSESKKQKTILISLISISFASQALFEGHPLDVTDPSILRYVSSFHLIFALFWSGSVVALFLNRTKKQYALTRVVSTVSILCVALFGSIISIFLLLPLQYPGHTSWVIFLIVKVGLLLLALGIGAFHHFAGRKMLVKEEFKIGRTLLFEVVVLCLVLVATSIMVSYTPPKVLLDSQLNKGSTSSISSNSSYTDIPLTFDNGEHGTFTVQRVIPGNPNMIMVFIDPKSKMKPKSVDVYLSNAKLKITDLHVKLVGYGNAFMAYGILPAAGIWHVNAQAIIDDFTESQASVTATLK